MTNVLVCIKRVAEASSEVVLTAEGMAVDGRNVGYTTSPNEEAAVEIATQVAGSTGGTCTVLTLGSPDSVEQLRNALAVGVDDGILIEGDADAFGPADVAAAIADVVRERDVAGTAYGLVLLGNDAADTGDFQVGVRLSYLLDRPVVAGVATVEVDGDRAVCSGDTPEGSAVYDVPLPAVVTVLEGGVSPRYPSLVGRMKAKKAPVETVTPTVVPIGSGRRSLTVPAPPPNEVTMLGEGAAAAPAVVEVLRSLGVVR